MGDDPKKRPALQVIVLGSGGGPQESNITAFLVRSVAEEWRKGSVVAVDAGVHLSAITRLIQEALPSPPPSVPYTLTSGPFAGLSMPFKSVAANAAHVTRHLVETYLITHPHLDHISGFVVNTASLQGTKPKKLAALPNTIQALKTHIFNNVIWPNLSDENNGAGLVTYLRLVEGGSPALGEGEGKGYSEVCDGLQVKTWSVSHGHCIERHSHRGSLSAASPHDGGPPSRRPSQFGQFGSQSGNQFGLPVPRASSLLSVGSGSATCDSERMCVYDSSAYFIQDQTHQREVLIFGDVEPDSISLSPRNLQIWQEAGPKVAAGHLAAIFIECSYEDAQEDELLFGHLKPFYIIEELQVLAEEVERAHKTRHLESKKRKRTATNADEPPRRNPSLAHTIPEDCISPKDIRLPMSAPETPHLTTPTREMSLNSPTTGTQGQLEGLKIVVIHIKDRLDDGPDVGETILGQLQEYEKEAQLGCEFVISKPGQSFYL